jgi:hypothetical protein
MKITLSLLSLIILSSSQNALSQPINCFHRFRQEGIAAYEAANYESAIRQFKAAMECDDIPKDNDLILLMENAKNGYIDYIEKLVISLKNEQLRCDSLWNEAEQAKQEAYIQAEMAKISEAQAKSATVRADSLRVKAEQKARESKAIAFAAKAQLEFQHEESTSLNLATLAYLMFPSSEETRRTINDLLIYTNRHLFKTSFTGHTEIRN